MTDAELCRAVALLWVDNGGDADGLNWCLDDLKAFVRAEIKHREAEAKRDEAR